MKKVLLIHPWIEDFSAYDFWIKPMGFLTVGTLLRKAGFTPSELGAYVLYGLPGQTEDADATYVESWKQDAQGLLPQDQRVLSDARISL